jgi:hypothetical protein
VAHQCRIQRSIAKGSNQWPVPLPPAYRALSVGYIVGNPEQQKDAAVFDPLRLVELARVAIPNAQCNWCLLPTADMGPWVEGKRAPPVPCDKAVVLPKSLRDLLAEKVFSRL